MASTDSMDIDLHKTKRILKELLEHTIEGIAIIGDDERIEYVNNRICEILGTSRDEIIGQSFKRFIHPTSSDIAIEHYTSRLDGALTPSTYEIKVVRGDDESRTLHLSSSVLTNGENKIKILAQVHDVTEERCTQSSLSDYLMKYSTLVETMNEGLGVIDDEGIFIHANTALCKMLDYTNNELVGRSTADIMHGDNFDAVFDKIKDRMAGKSTRYETHLVHRSGSLIPTMVSGSPLFNEDGAYTGSFAIFTDITKQKKIEKDLQTTRNRSLLYLDLMSHDIRNHLQEIQVAAELIQYNTGTPTAAELVERILDSVSKSSGIISETRTIDTLAKLPLTDRSLDITIKETVMAAITHFDDVDFRMSIQISDALVRADEYLELLLSDLLSNACQRCSHDVKRVWITLTENMTAYELVVSDNGSGIPDVHANDLLTPSQRLSGLHLYLAHYIVEKYGGVLEVFNRVQDEPHQGLSIKVNFPKTH